MIATYLTFICCVFNEKIVKNDSCSWMQGSYKFRKSKQIIQTLQPLIIDNFSTHSYKVDILTYFLFFMIWELIFKTFIPVSRIFDNEDDIFTFFRNVRKSSASEILFLRKEIKSDCQYCNKNHLKLRLRSPSPLF